MASITKRSGKWLVSIRRSFHKPVYKVFVSKIDAQRWSRETERLIEMGDFLDTSEAKKKEEEFLASLSAEEKRAYKCEKTFNFKKKSEKYNDCIFKLYEADLDLERLNLEKQKLELQKQIADQQNQQKLLNEQAEKDSLALEQKKTQDERAEAKAALAIEKQKLKAARALAEAARQQAYEAARQAEELRQANQIQRDIEQQKRARESLRQLQKQTRGECTILLGNC